MALFSTQESRSRLCQNGLKELQLTDLCSQVLTLFCPPQCVKCRSADENLTEPGTKQIWSSGSYNELLLHDSLWIPLIFLFFPSYYQETLAGCLRVYSAFLFQPKRADFIFAVTLLSLRLPHFVRPERQPALCYQGKVHLFRVSSYGGFWASKSQSVFLTLCFFSVSWESVKYCIHTVHCTVQIEHL